MVRFGKIKTWHIATHLAKRLVREMAQPLNCLQNTFKLENLTSAKVISYSTLKSLNVMYAIKDKHFLDVPSVLTELIKFLALNTELDAVKDLTPESRDLKSTLNELKKGIILATKAAQTTSNKVNVQKILVESL